MKIQSAAELTILYGCVTVVNQAGIKAGILNSSSVYGACSIFVVSTLQDPADEGQLEYQKVS